MITDVVMSLARRGIPVRVMRELDVRLEPETFSGGWNESARRRNRKKVGATVFTIGGEQIVCSQQAFDAFFRPLVTP